MKNGYKIVLGVSTALVAVGGAFAFALGGKPSFMASADDGQSWINRYENANLAVSTNPRDLKEFSFKAIPSDSPLVSKGASLYYAVSPVKVNGMNNDVFSRMGFKVYDICVGGIWSHSSNVDVGSKHYDNFYSMYLYWSRVIVQDKENGDDAYSFLGVENSLDGYDFGGVKNTAWNVAYGNKGVSVVSDVKNLINGEFGKISSDFSLMSDPDKSVAFNYFKAGNQYSSYGDFDGDLNYFYFGGLSGLSSKPVHLISNNFLRKVIGNEYGNYCFVWQWNGNDALSSYDEYKNAFDRQFSLAMNSDLGRASLRDSLFSMQSMGERFEDNVFKVNFASSLLGGSQVADMPFKMRYSYRMAFSPGTSTTIEVFDPWGMIGKVLTMPFTFVANAFNITVFGGTEYAFTLSNLILSFVGIILVFSIIKLILKLVKK